MNRIKQLLCFFLVCISFISIAQDQDKGIKWTTGLSWDQVKQKAKLENKYIFLDCFTTWCGPCKMMDKSTYVNDSVRDYLNAKFISIKAQMDKTRKDNEEVQRWYQDALTIGKEYHIEAYPTLIFISPEGKLVQKEVGFKGVNDFIALAKKSTVPGMVYKDPYDEYESLIIEYKKGIKHYDRMVYMIQAALQFDTTLSQQLINDYMDHVSKIDAKKRYSKDNIGFWAMFTHRSNSRVFQFFYKDGNLINRMMKQPGYAERVVDRTIFYELVLPFLEKQNKNRLVQFEGMYLGGTGLVTDYAEADWKELERIIKQKYNFTVAERNLLKAKKEWYQRHGNKEAVVRVYLTLINKFSLIEEPDDPLYQELNYKAFEAFLLITDLKIIKAYLPWVKSLVNKFPEVHYYLDTYANLLYKLGRIKEAIKWEEKAFKLSLSKGDVASTEGYKLELERMKKNQPTYPGQVNWNGTKWLKWENVSFHKEFMVKSFSGEWLSGACIKIKDNKEMVFTQSGGRAAVKVSVGDIVIISKDGYIPQQIVIDKTPSIPLVDLKPI